MAVSLCSTFRQVSFRRMLTAGDSQILKDIPTAVTVMPKETVAVHKHYPLLKNRVRQSCRYLQIPNLAPLRHSREIKATLHLKEWGDKNGMSCPLKPIPKLQSQNTLCKAGSNLGVKRSSLYKHSCRESIYSNDS